MALDPEWRRRFDEVQGLVRDVPVLVLVWGPGVDSGTLAAAKRQTVRADLEGLLGNGKVLFSEDPDLQDVRASGEFVAEYYEVVSADAVVLIAESMGAIAEAGLYHEEMVGKTIVFTSERSRPGFAREAYVRHHVEEVTQEEWLSCTRIRRVAREFVERIRIAKFQRSPPRFSWQ
jgi:hypothetical protein